MFFCFGLPPDWILLTALSALMAASQNAVTSGDVCAAAGAIPTRAPAVPSATRNASVRMILPFPCCFRRGGNLRHEPFRGQFAQNLVVRLPRRIALERVDEEEAPRLLVSGELAATP